MLASNAQRQSENIEDAFGALLKDWRGRRRLSQLALGLDANVSQRHVAFLERGKAKPSRGMVLNLSRTLDLPLSAQNDMLTAAGYAPLYPRRALDDPTLAPVRRAMERLIHLHEPFPALVIDADWRMVAANRPAQAMYGPLLEPFGGDMIALFVENARARDIIENWTEVGHELLERLLREARLDGRADDDRIRAFTAMVHETCGPKPEPQPGAQPSPLMATIIRLGEMRLAFHSTLASFGGPQDVGLSELRAELFFPADDATEAAMETMAARLVTGS